MTMSDKKKIVVPEGMLKAANSVTTQWQDAITCNTIIQRPDPDEVQRIVEAALRWLMENPIRPNITQSLELAQRYAHEGSWNGITIHQWIAEEWQRRMFDAPEPEVPELVWQQTPVVRVLRVPNNIINDLIVVFGVRSDGVLIEEQEVIEFGDDAGKERVIASLKAKVEKRLNMDTLNTDLNLEIHGLMFGKRRQNVYADEANWRILEAYRRGQRNPK